MKIKSPSKDRIISSLPEPFFSIGVFLFMPKLWRILKSANVSQNESSTLLTIPGKGHIRITDDEITVM